MQSMSAKLVPINLVINHCQRVEHRHVMLRTAPRRIEVIGDNCATVGSQRGAPPVSLVADNASSARALPWSYLQPHRCFCKLRGREQIPGTCPSNGFQNGRHQLLCRPQPEANPSVTEMMPSDKMTDGASSSANRKPSFAGTAYCEERDACGAFAINLTNVPFSTVKSKTSPPFGGLYEKEKKNDG